MMKAKLLEKSKFCFPPLGPALLLLLFLLYVLYFALDLFTLLSFFCATYDYLSYWTAVVKNCYVVIYRNCPSAYYKCFPPLWASACIIGHSLTNILTR